MDTTRRKAFVAAAVKARDEAMRTGKGYFVEDVRKEFAAGIAGKPVKRARLRRWRK